MWIALLAVMRKELRQTFRDKRMAAILLLVPIVQLTVLGYAVDLEVDHIPTVVCDQDRTPASRELADAFVATSIFERKTDVIDAEQASDMLESGKAAAALIIPAGFERDVQRNIPASVQVLVDGTDPNRAQIAANSASQFLLDRAVKMTLALVEQQASALGRAVRPTQARIVPRVLYNPRLKSATYMVPGVAAMVLLIVTTIVTAMGLAREREIGTMEQILVTPLRPSILLIGKCLPFALLGLVLVPAILTVGSYLFQVPIRGSLAVIFTATLLYLMTTLGTGVFISTISRSQQQAILGGFFFLMPAILLSGFMTPIENMPWWIRPITYVNPVRYFVEILRGCLLKGAGFSELMPQLLALAVFGASILTLSTLRFRKQLG
ncbi:MAG: ABC transporter permease [Deltaproteobacteria bacterium]|nr:ABC transporter permease [Deltaproteobacteria bacterium]